MDGARARGQKGKRDNSCACVCVFQLISIISALLVSEWPQIATLVIFPLSGRRNWPHSDLAHWKMLERRSCPDMANTQWWNTEPHNIWRTTPPPHTEGVQRTAAWENGTLKKTHHKPWPWNETVSCATSDWVTPMKQTLQMYLYEFLKTFCCAWCYI